MAVAPKPLTLEQFQTLPEEEPALEFAEGMVTQKVSPQGKHSRLHSVLVQHLDRAGQAGNVAVAFPELRTTFAGASTVPDIAVYRWNRIPVDKKGQVANRFTKPPDITVEIASPDQSVTGLVRRCLWYVSNGVAVALLVDPADESVLAFRPNQPMQAWKGSDRIDVSDILPDFELTVEDLFASLKVR